MRYSCSLVLLLCVACQAASANAPPASPAPLASPAPSANVVPGAPAAPAAGGPRDLAPELVVPASAKLVLKARGKGVQIYACSPKDDPSAFEWKLKAPEADLLDDTGAKVARHFAGPTWESSDGSSVVASMAAKVPAPDASAIDWLRLTHKSNSGSGVLAAVTDIQRLDTHGGKAPKDGCDAQHAKAELRVPYEATYYFYAAPAP